MNKELNTGKILDSYEEIFKDLMKLYQSSKDGKIRWDIMRIADKINNIKKEFNTDQHQKANPKLNKQK
jgi:hypothetical protein